MQARQRRHGANVLTAPRPRTVYCLRPNLPISIAFAIALAFTMYPASEALAPLMH